MTCIVLNKYILYTGSASEKQYFVERANFAVIYLRRNREKPQIMETTLIGILPSCVDKTLVFFYLIYFKIRYLTAIIYDETRITIRATHTKKY
jgi:hypothetical protein